MLRRGKEAGSRIHGWGLVVESCGGQESGKNRNSQERVYRGKSPIFELMNPPIDS